MTISGPKPNTENPSPRTVAALYKFVRVDDVPALRDALFALGEKHGLAGTLLVAPEGINGTVAGSAEAVAALETFLRSDARFAERLSWKISYANRRPFRKWLVKIKKEIVTLRSPEADPAREVGAYVKPGDWNALISRPDITLVDTRNDYEVEAGTFSGAIDPKTAKFADFPAWAAENLDPERHPKVAMFCTGGIRCEKASSLLLARGFREVYHLEGGILKYLETVPPEKSAWRGECYVFDERETLGHGLKERRGVACDARGDMDAEGHRPHDGSDSGRIRAK